MLHTIKSLLVLLPTVPGPPRLSARHNAGTTVLVNWQPPDATFPGLELRGYRLQFGRKDVTPPTVLEFAPWVQEYVLNKVHHGATYEFRLSAKSPSGFGEEALREIAIPEAAPRGPPRIIQGSDVTCCSVWFSWLPPDLAERNGAITEYTVAYREAGSARNPRELTLPATETSHTIGGLSPGSAYDVKIRAHTRVGAGPYSRPARYRTAAFQTGRACWFFFIGAKKEKQIKMREKQGQHQHRHTNEQTVC